MPTVEATIIESGWFSSGNTVYVTAQAADSAYLYTQYIQQRIGQYIIEFGTGNSFSVNRNAIWFDLSDVPKSASITACTLKIYGAGAVVGDDFIIYLVSVSGAANPLIPENFSLFGTTDMGQLNTTGWNAAGFNTLTFNAAGLVDINTALQSGLYAIGLRSKDDVDATEPADGGYVDFEGAIGTNIPVLTITYSTWPDIYPQVPQFPVTGKIDLPTLTVISDHMTALDAEIDDIADGDGNIDLAVANWILWTGTGEKIAYDNATSHVTITSLESTTPLTLAGDLTSDDVTADDISAVDGTVGNDMTLAGIEKVNTIYSKLADNEVVFSALASPGAPDDETVDIFMEPTTGDLTAKIRNDGLGGLKTALLGDFSDM